MTQIQTKVWAPRPAPFKPKAIDADNDGIVQEGTIWERPAGANFVDAAGNVLDALLTALPSGARMVDAKGSPIKEYTPKALRGKPPTAAAPKQGFRANTLGGMTGTLGTRYGTLESRHGTLESTRGTIGDQRTVVGDITRAPDVKVQATRDIDSPDDVAAKPGVPKSHDHWHKELFKKDEKQRIDIDSPEYADAPSVSSERREALVEDFRVAVDSILKNAQSGFQMRTKKGKSKAYVENLRNSGLNEMAEIIEGWLDAKGDADKERAILNDYMFGASAHGATEMWDIPDAVYVEFETMMEGIYGEDKMRNAIAAAGTKHMSLAKNFVFAAMEGDEGTAGVNISGGQLGKVAEVGLGELKLRALTHKEAFGKTNVGGWTSTNGTDGIVRHEYAHHLDKALMAASDMETSDIFNCMWSLTRLRAWQDSDYDELLDPKDAFNIVSGNLYEGEGTEIMVKNFEFFTRSANEAGMSTAEELATIVSPITPSMYGFSEPAEMFSEVFALTTNRDYDEATHVSDNWREAAQFMNTLHGHLESGGGLDTFVGALEEAGLGFEDMRNTIRELIAGLSEANREALKGIVGIEDEFFPDGDG